VGSEQSPFDKSSLMYNFGKESWLEIYFERTSQQVCDGERNGDHCSLICQSLSTAGLVGHQLTGITCIGDNRKRGCVVMSCDACFLGDLFSSTFTPPPRLSVLCSSRQATSLGDGLDPTCSYIYIL